MKALILSCLTFLCLNAKAQTPIVDFTRDKDNSVFVQDIIDLKDSTQTKQVLLN